MFYIFKTTLVLAFSLFLMGCKECKYIVARNYAEMLLHAQTSLKSVYPLTLKHPGLTIQEAYEIQRHLSDGIKSAYDTEIIGYKIAFSSPSSQEKFGITEPAFGRLFTYMKRDNASLIKLSNFIKPFIEVEIGFIIKNDMDSLPQDIDELASNIEGVFPAIELPDIRFKKIKELKAQDLIADNAGASQFIMGKVVSFNELDLEKVKVWLYRNDKLIDQGLASCVLGNPLNSLRWLCQKLNEQGLNLKSNDLVITGALGRVIPARPGKYHAFFGTLGMPKHEAWGYVKFEIE
jgi:2-keto-4-pentenoate hydratase